MHMYPKCNHGFHDDSTGRYDEKNAQLAWERTIAFSSSTLRSSASGSPPPLRLRADVAFAVETHAHGAGFQVALADDEQGVDLRGLGVGDLRPQWFMPKSISTR